MKKSIFVTTAAVGFSVAVAMANANTVQLPTTAKSMIHLTANTSSCSSCSCCGCCGVNSNSCCGCCGDDGSDS